MTEWKWKMQIYTLSFEIAETLLFGSSDLPEFVETILFISKYVIQVFGNTLPQLEKHIGTLTWCKPMWVIWGYLTFRHIFERHSCVVIPLRWFFYPPSYSMKPNLSVNKFNVSLYFPASTLKKKNLCCIELNLALILLCIHSNEY